MILRDYLKSFLKMASFFLQVHFLDFFESKRLYEYLIRWNNIYIYIFW